MVGKVKEGLGVSGLENLFEASWRCLFAGQRDFLSLFFWQQKNQNCRTDAVLSGRATFR